MATIRCYDEDGTAVPVAPEAITFSPAVYGVFIENQTILLYPHPRTGRWVLPGGILGRLDTPSQAVRHHVRDLIGITPVLGPLLHIEDQHIIDNNRRAWHLSIMYYALQRPPLTATSLAELDSKMRAEFVPLDTLERTNLQFGYEAILAGHARQTLS